MGSESRSGRHTLMTSTLVAAFFVQNIRPFNTRYMDSYMYALRTSRTERLLQAAHAVKPAL